VNRRDLAALVAAAAVVSTGWLIFGTQASLPDLRGAARGWSGDFIDYYLPNAEYAGARLAQGQIPLWNPHHSAGGPFLATLQAGVLYPPNLLHAWMPAQTAFLVLAVLHVGLAALLAGGLAGALGAGRWGSAVAGLAYATSLQVVGTIWSPATHYAAAWAPGVFWAVDRSLEHPVPARAAVLAAAIGLALLSGWPYTFAMVTLASAIYTAAILGTRAVRTRQLPWRPILTLAVGGILGLMLAAPQMLPSMELVGRSCRALGALVEAQAIFVGKPHSPQSFFTDLFARGYTDGVPGALSLLLAPLALVLPGRGRGRVAVLLGIGLLALATSWPAHAPLYGWLREVPVLGDFRFPYKYRLVLTLALAVAAGVGTTHLQHALARWPRVALAAGAVAWGLTFATGAWPVWSMIQPFARSLPEPVSLAEELSRAGTDAAIAPGGRIYWPSRGDRQRVWRESYAIHDLEPLSLARSAQLITYFETGRPLTIFTRGSTPRRKHSREGPAAPFSGRMVLPRSGDRARILDLFSVGTVVGEPDYGWLEQRYRRVSPPDASVAVYEKPHAMPRVYRVARAVAEPAGLPRAVRLLAEESFDPWRVVMVDEVPPRLRGRGPFPAAADPDDTRLLVYEPERVVIRSQGEAPGLVVLTDAHYPGWEATLDGEPVRILRANLDFRAVVVPAGVHEIEMRYRPGSFRTGILLAGLSVLACGGAGILGRGD